jgi:hypothetical protein
MVDDEMLMCHTFLFCNLQCVTLKGA